MSTETDQSTNISTNVLLEDEGQTEDGVSVKANENVELIFNEPVEKFFEVVKTFWVNAIMDDIVDNESGYKSDVDLVFRKPIEDQIENVGEEVQENVNDEEVTEELYFRQPTDIQLEYVYTVFERKPDDAEEEERKTVLDLKSQPEEDLDVADFVEEIITAVQKTQDEDIPKAINPDFEEDIGNIQFVFETEATTNEVKEVPTEPVKENLNEVIDEVNEVRKNETNIEETSERIQGSQEGAGIPEGIPEDGIPEDTRIDPFKNEDGVNTMEVKSDAGILAESITCKPEADVAEEAYEKIETEIEEDMINSKDDEETDEKTVYPTNFDAPQVSQEVEFIEFPLENQIEDAKQDSLLLEKNDDLKKPTSAEAPTITQSGMYSFQDKRAADDKENDVVNTMEVKSDSGILVEPIASEPEADLVQEDYEKIEPEIDEDMINSKDDEEIDEKIVYPPNFDAPQVSKEVEYTEFPLENQNEDVKQNSDDVLMKHDDLKKPTSAEAPSVTQVAMETFKDKSAADGKENDVVNTTEVKSDAGILAESTTSEPEADIVQDFYEKIEPEVNEDSINSIDEEEIDEKTVYPTNFDVSWIPPSSKNPTENDNDAAVETAMQKLDITVPSDERHHTVKHMLESRRKTDKTAEKTNEGSDTTPELNAKDTSIEPSHIPPSDIKNTKSVEEDTADFQDSVILVEPIANEPEADILQEAYEKIEPEIDEDMINSKDDEEIDEKIVYPTNFDAPQVSQEVEYIEFPLENQIEDAKQDSLLLMKDDDLKKPTSIEAPSVTQSATYSFPDKSVADDEDNDVVNTLDVKSKSGILVEPIASEPEADILQEYYEKIEPVIDEDSINSKDDEDSDEKTVYPTNSDAPQEEVENTEFPLENQIEDVNHDSHDFLMKNDDLNKPTSAPSVTQSAFQDKSEADDKDNDVVNKTHTFEEAQSNDKPAIDNLETIHDDAPIDNFEKSDDKEPSSEQTVHTTDLEIETFHIAEDELEKKNIIDEIIDEATTSPIIVTENDVSEIAEITSQSEDTEEKEENYAIHEEKESDVNVETRVDEENRSESSIIPTIASQTVNPVEAIHEYNKAEVLQVAGIPNKIFETPSFDGAMSEALELNSREEEIVKEIITTPEASDLESKIFENNDKESSEISEVKTREPQDEFVNDYVPFGTEDLSFTKVEASYNKEDENETSESNTIPIREWKDEDVISLKSLKSLVAEVGCTTDVEPSGKINEQIIIERIVEVDEPEETLKILKVSPSEPSLMEIDISEDPSIIHVPIPLLEPGLPFFFDFFSVFVIFGCFTPKKFFLFRVARSA